MSDLKSEIYLRTPGSQGLNLPAYNSDDWATPMNVNWDRIDTLLKQIKDLADANAAIANQLSGGSTLQNRILNPDFWYSVERDSVGITSASTDVNTAADGWHHTSTSNEDWNIANIGEGIEIRLEDYELNPPGVLTLFSTDQGWRSLAGETVSFSVDYRRAEYSSGSTNADLYIDIYDGVGSTASSTIVVSNESYSRVSVTHTVNSSPTTLQYRIVLTLSKTSQEDEYVIFRRAAAVVGSLSEVSYKPRPDLDERASRWVGNASAHNGLYNVYRFAAGIAGDVLIQPVSLSPLDPDVVSGATSFHNPNDITTDPDYLVFQGGDDTDVFDAPANMMSVKLPVGTGTYASVSNVRLTIIEVLT